MKRYTQSELAEVVRLHGRWLRSEAGGVRADLSGSDLSGSNLSGSNLSGSNLTYSNLTCSNLSGSNLRGSNLRGCNLSGSNLSGSDLSGSNLRGCNLSGCDLSGSDLSGCDLRGCNLTCSNLSGCNLSGRDLSGSNLSGSDLSGCDLSGCNLSGCNLSGCNLSGRDLSGCNLSGCTNLLSQQAFMQDNFTHDRRGFIVYKTFNSQYTAPAAWVIKPGSIIEEVCNPDRCNDCGSGVNVATLEWVKRNSSGTIWKCRIAWKDAPGIVVPYMTDGKIRTERVELIEVVGVE